MSLTSRLLAGFTLIASIGFWLMLDKVLDRVERQYLEAAEEPMVDMANVLAEWLETQWQQGHALDTSGLEAAFRGAKAREVFAKIYGVAKTRIDMDVYVTDAQGNVLYDSLHPESVGEKRERRDITLTLAGRYGARSTRENEDDPNSSIMFVAAPIHGNGETVGVVSVAKPQRSTFAFRDETKWWLTRTIGTLTLCMVLGSFLLARWTTRPIRRLTDYARAITRGERPPVPRLHGSEMKTLADAFEKMRDSLENRESVEQYVQTLTHELKSPVAAIRGASELLQERSMPETRRGQFLGNIQSESLRLQDLLDRLLALASLEKQKTLDEPCEVDFTALAYAVCEQFGPVCEQRSLKLEASITDNVMVWGDAFLLH
ncbi:MAG: two-component system sensor histidine kinase CreC, partial [Roseimicrobium sp.]